MDAKTGAYILDLFREINRETGLTIVIVTHDQGLASQCDRVLHMRDGMIETPDETIEPVE